MLLNSENDVIKMIFLFDQELTDDVEKSFFKALSCLKKNDPKIYDESVNFFDPSTQQTPKETSNSSVKSSNPIYLEEYKRKILLERGPEFDDTVEIDGNLFDSVQLLKV